MILLILMVLAYIFEPRIIFLNMISPSRLRRFLCLCIDLRKPTQQGMESGPPLFSDAQMNQIYTDPTKRYIDSNFVDTIDEEQVPKRYQG